MITGQTVDITSREIGRRLLAGIGAPAGKWVAKLKGRDVRITTGVSYDSPLVMVIRGESPEHAVAMFECMEFAE